MENLKNLTKQDIEILKDFGYVDDDLLQIDKAITKTDYYYHHNGTKEKITHKQVRELLGNKQFLSGISRSAFHYSSCREIDGKGCVDFDSRKMFKEFEKEAKIEEEIIQIFENKYRIANTDNIMLPANSTQLEKYSKKKLNELCNYGILQKTYCEGLAYEFNSDYLKNTVIPKIQDEQLQNLKTFIEGYSNKYIKNIEIEDIEPLPNNKGWKLNIDTPLWENFSFDVQHNGNIYKAISDIKYYIDYDYDFTREEYIDTFEKCKGDCSEKSFSLNFINQETELLKSALQDFAQYCSNYDIVKVKVNDNEPITNKDAINNEEPDMDL